MTTTPDIAPNTADQLSDQLSEHITKLANQTPEEAVPSAFPHNTYRFTNEDNTGYGENKLERIGTTANSQTRTQLVGSGIVGSAPSPLYGRAPTWKQHTVMLDLDIPAALIPSSTPGHSHLYIDLPIPWDKYKNLLKALLEAGIIEQGFYDSAIRNHQTHLRMPGITKATGAPPF